MTSTLSFFMKIEYIDYAFISYKNHEEKITRYLQRAW